MAYGFNSNKEKVSVVEKNNFILISGTARSSVTTINLNEYNIFTISQVMPVNIMIYSDDLAGWTEVVRVYNNKQYPYIEIEGEGMSGQSTLLHINIYNASMSNTVTYRVLLYKIA